MYKTAKTAIRVYGKLGRTAKEIEGLIGRVALGSFSDVAPCSDICERMCLLIEKKNILINLKVKITEALRALSEEDRALLAVKFGKNKRELYLSRRTYFRRLNGALSAFEAELARQGVTEGAIADYYGKNIFMIGVIYDEVCEEEQIKLQVAKKLKVNRSYSSTLTGAV